MSAIIKYNATQEKEILNQLEEIAPQWAKYLKTSRDEELWGGDSGDRKLDIESGCRCIAGEAHGFSNEYSDTYKDDYCHICDDYSIQMVCVAAPRSDIPIKDIDDDDQEYASRYDYALNAVKEFTAHFKKEHKK